MTKKLVPVELLDDVRDYILNKAGRHDLNWRDGHHIVDQIDALQDDGQTEPNAAATQIQPEKDKATGPRRSDR